VGDYGWWWHLAGGKNTSLGGVEHGCVVDRTSRSGQRDLVTAVEFGADPMPGHAIGLFGDSG